MPVHIHSPKGPALPPPSALFGSSLFEHPPPSVYSSAPRRNSLFDHPCSNDITSMSRPLYILPPPTTSPTTTPAPPPPSTTYHHHHHHHHHQYPNNGLSFYAQDSPGSTKRHHHQHQAHHYPGAKREFEKVPQQHLQLLHHQTAKRRRHTVLDNDQEAVNAAAATLASFATAHQAPFDSICCGDGGDKECAGRGNLACDQCQTCFQHARCLQRHRWEHAEGWKEIQGQLGMSKRQQVQLMEAAQILMDIARCGMRVSMV